MTESGCFAKHVIMFIRKVTHKNKKNRKKYHTYKLVDSIRTERGPRQRDILNLGADFDLPKEQWKNLANCIEAIITGQKPLFDYPKEIRTLAKKYASTIIRQQSCTIDAGEDISEGSGKYNPKARYGGNSKEKRNDCPLVTLGLVLDMQGFPKKSRIFEGNISEPKFVNSYQHR